LLQIKNEHDCLVFLGDYVNRGSYSREVIEELVGLQAKKNCVFLEGNHDAALRDFLATGDLYPFLLIGGAATIRSYLSSYEGDIRGRMLSAMPSTHRHFLEGLRSEFVVDGEFAAAHEKSALEGYVADGHFGIYGHSVIEGRRPVITSEFAALDTGCGLVDGYLSCLSWPARTVTRVDALGNLTP
jgi:hypothetical protein